MMREDLHRGQSTRLELEDKHVAISPALLEAVFTNSALHWGCRRVSARAEEGAASRTSDFFDRPRGVSSIGGRNRWFKKSRTLNRLKRA